MNWTNTPSASRACIEGVEFLNTVFLSDKEVEGYLRSLLEKLDQLAEEKPTTWCPIGPSGMLVAQVAMRIAGEQAATFRIMPIICDRSTGNVSFPDEADPRQVVQGNRVLLVDGAVHSGSTLSKAFRAVEELGPVQLSSYALAVRAGASFIPNFFSLLVKDHDRVHFLRETIPNHRLMDFGCMRILSAEDCGMKMVCTGKTFIDKFDWSDLLYEMRVDHKRRTYLYERGGAIQGFVSFRLKRNRTLLVDTLGTDRQAQGQGIAGHMLRWVEILGRHQRCGAIDLWAIAERRPWYETRGFEARGTRLVLDGETFLLMRRKLLYNLPDDLMMG
jgi:hypoxanthine-guanine phosphoribosyltransferase